MSLIKKIGSIILAILAGIGAILFYNRKSPNKPQDNPFKPLEDKKKEELDKIDESLKNVEKETEGMTTKEMLDYWKRG